MKTRNDAALCEQRVGTQSHVNKSPIQMHIRTQAQTRTQLHTPSSHPKLGGQWTHHSAELENLAVMKEPVPKTTGSMYKLRGLAGGGTGREWGTTALLTPFSHTHTHSTLVDVLMLQVTSLFLLPSSCRLWFIPPSESHSEQKQRHSVLILD